MNAFSFLFDFSMQFFKKMFYYTILDVGGEDLHQLHLHRHVDGEEHLDGVRLPQDQGVLPGETRSRVSGNLRLADLNLALILTIDVRSESVSLILKCS